MGLEVKGSGFRVGLEVQGFKPRGVRDVLLGFQGSWTCTFT